MEGVVIALFLRSETQSPPPIPGVPARQPEFLGSHLGSHSPIFAPTAPTHESRKPRYFLDPRRVSRMGLEPTTYGLKVR